MLHGSGLWKASWIRIHSANNRQKIAKTEHVLHKNVTYPNWLTLKHADPHNRDYLVPVLLSAHYRTWRNSPGTSSRVAAELAPDDGGHLVPQHGQNSADRTRLLFYMVNILHMCRISVSYTGGNSFYKRSVL